ncbi:MAG: hypothetical protein FJ119_13100 [Deltaproteobacteria bacterium]|nr:hypothetical protein [Deltaproteobacteria bacterium]
MQRTERTGDFEEILRGAMESSQSRIWTSLPGIITAVNLTAQTVSVQPAIKGLVQQQAGGKQAVDLPMLVDCPIVWPRAGGFSLTFPVAAGDECLVVFASRCIDGWWQSGGTQEPAELRMHDLSDGFAVLAPASQTKVLTGVSADNVQLRDEAGTTFLEITPDGEINITALTEVVEKAPKIKLQDVAGTTKIEIGYTAGKITIAANTLIAINAPTLNIGAIGGQVNLFGDVQQYFGTLTDQNGVELSAHKHTGVQTGSGTSGAPTN